MSCSGREVIKIAVVDDQRAFVESLRIVIDTQDDLTCVGTAGNGDDAVRLVRTTAPDVVVMDVGMPESDGIAATARILAESPDTAIVILTGRPDGAVLARAAAAGASAFLLKDSSIEEILDAVRQPRSRRLVVDRAAIDRILGESTDLSPGVGTLTQRELEVLALLAEGRQPKTIASKLGISLPTCRGYVKTLTQKLGAHSALEAVVLAYRYGVIRLPEFE